MPLKTILFSLTSSQSYAIMRIISTLSEENHGNSRSTNTPHARGIHRF